MKILICEDDLQIQSLLVRVLSKNPEYELSTFDDGQSTLEAVSQNHYDLYLVDVELPDMKGTDILKEILNKDRESRVVIMTAYSSEELVIECMRLGAYNYLKKPFDIDLLRAIIKEALPEQKNKSNEAFESNDFYSMLNKVIDKNVSVLLTGETGTGKEYFASYISKQSSREKFIAVNCPAIPKEIAESELFGHEKGAFTGAISQKIGKFEVADKGILFLDEVADLSLEIQAKLLRVLQEREIERVGGHVKIKFDAIVISATSRNIPEMISNGEFREDLYYRLADVELRVPPLRERLHEIPSLVKKFIDEYYQGVAQEQKKTIDQSVITEFMSYSWPGNVRELRSVVRRILIFCDEKVIKSDSISDKISTLFIGKKNDKQIQRSEVATLADSQRDVIIDSLIKNNYNLSKVSRELNISRSTLYRKIKKYQINLKVS